VQELLDRFEKFKKSIGFEDKVRRIEILEKEVSSPDLWNDADRARSVTQELADLKREIVKISEIGETLAILKEIPDELEISKVESALSKLELLTFLSGKYDQKNALMAIHAGQGGTEAMDWVSMLFRMYSRYIERRGWSLDVIDLTPGEEAGIKSVTFEVYGKYAYGYLKNEAGTHRLVRQSPFNADKLRQTSFALVEVLPELNEIDLPEIEIKDEDLSWQFVRSGGHGGQNVNKVSTAVRLTHIPTGIVVTAQSERFQEQNRKIALNLLRSKLWILEKERADKEKKELKGDYRPASWGTQIRSYVLHPYKMVKDLRTGVETGRAEAFLDGEMDDFIDAELKIN
jgi:peptide chain release factor 2